MIFALTGFQYKIREPLKMLETTGGSSSDLDVSKHAKNAVEISSKNIEYLFNYILHSKIGLHIVNML
jgi:hypothetical protein